MTTVAGNGCFDGPGSYGSVSVIDANITMLDFVDSANNSTGLLLDGSLSGGFGGGGGGTAKPPMRWVLVASEVRWKSDRFVHFARAAGWWIFPRIEISVS